MHFMKHLDTQLHLKQKEIQDMEIIISISYQTLQWCLSSLEVPSPETELDPSRISIALYLLDVFDHRKHLSPSEDAVQAPASAKHKLASILLRINGFQVGFPNFRPHSVDCLGKLEEKRLLHLP